MQEESASESLSSADEISQDLISSLVQQAKRYPAIRPSSCKCGKHSVYWIYAHPARREEALEWLAGDEQYLSLVKHIAHCGIEQVPRQQYTAPAIAPEKRV